MPWTQTEIPDGIKAQIFDLASPYIDIGKAEVLKQAVIVGIEATQSIQHHRSSEHLSARSGQGMDNALMLAALKPAWVRTYVRTTRFSALRDVRGTLTVERRSRGFVWSTVATIAPQGFGSVRARPFVDYDTERRNIFNSLNFVIPADKCVGVLRLTVRITDPSGTELDSSSTIVNATLKQTLRVRGILIGYSGPATSVMTPGSPAPPTITLAAPTVADLQATAARALLAMPVQSTGSFAAASQIVFNLPLDDARTGAGACSVNWGTLLARLATERTNDGNRSDVVYYGLLPSGMPIGVPGCGLDGLGAGIAGDAGTFLHEIGHGYGFVHTPCGAAGATDADYPDYAPYPSASIGEYGIDISTGAIFPPASTSDFMSYCGPQWMSLYQYARLVGHERLDPEWIVDDPIWEQYAPHRRFYRVIPEPGPDLWDTRVPRVSLISVIGTLHVNGEVEVSSVARVTAEPNPSGDALPLEGQLRDANGRVLARATLRALAGHGGTCCCGGCRDAHDTAHLPYSFQALIPDVAPGQALVIADRDEVLWQRNAPEEEPRITELSTSVRDTSLYLHWAVEQSGEAAEVWVQWSKQEQETWHGLATRLTDSPAEIDLSTVPTGTVWIRVLLHDGFHTVISEPLAIDVPVRALVVTIFTPQAGQKLYAGSPMRLWGSVSDGSGVPLPDTDDSFWMIDGAEGGRGADLWTTAPPAGEHRATLVVRVGDMQGRATVTFTTLEGFSDRCDC